MKTLLWMLLMGLFWRGNARAEDALVLFEQAPLRPGLCVALRIQLTDLAEVRCQADQPGALDVRIARVAQLVSEQGARLGVLLEADPDPAKVRMLVVGAAPDRAVLAVERVEARAEPDVDRALALKVRETFELSMRAARTPTLVVLPSRDVVAAVLELGGALQLAVRTAPMAVLAAGVRLERAARFAELTLSGRLASSTSARIPQSYLREDEWTLALSGRLGWTRGRLTFGPALDIGVTRLSARGETADGRRGDATLAFLRLDLGLDLRWLLWHGPAPVQLRFAPALELDPAAQRFTLDGRSALDLGHVRAWLPLTLVVGLPVQGRS